MADDSKVREILEEARRQAAAFGVRLPEFGPETTPSAQQSEPERPLSTSESIIASRVPLLSGEATVFSLRGERLQLSLTNRRVILHGEAARLGLFAGGSVTKVAFVRDVDVVAATSRYLPDWLALLGILIAVYSLLAASDGAKVLLALLGATMLAVWYLWRSDVIELSVSGAAQVSVPVSGFGSEGSSQVDGFVKAFFDVKADLTTQTP